MRQIITVKGQTLSDIAVQEYGNIEAIFQLVVDNPHLVGMNEFPLGYVQQSEADFDIAYPVKSGIVINIQDSIEIENTLIANDLSTVISDGKNIE